MITAVVRYQNKNVLSIIPSSFLFALSSSIGEKIDSFSNEVLKGETFVCEHVLMTFRRNYILDEMPQGIANAVTLSLAFVIKKIYSFGDFHTIPNEREQLIISALKGNGKIIPNSP